MFRKLAFELAQDAYVIAPDLPGHGKSDVLPDVSFSAIADAISELLAHLQIGPRFIYLHDWGAPVGLQLAMQTPEQVLGLIIQNANAHQTGWGSGWLLREPTGRNRTLKNEAAATAHLTFEGTRDTYVSGVPLDVAVQIPAEHWEERLAGDESARSHADAACTNRGLRQLCGSLRCDRAVSRGPAAARVDGLG